VHGPGTADTHVVPSTGRALVSRGANRVIVGGVVSGTWSPTHGRLDVSWFAGAEQPSRTALAYEARRLAALVDRNVILS
jgi:hypothetical protein